MRSVRTMVAKQCGKCGISLDENGGCSVCMMQLGLSHVAQNAVAGNALPTVEELNSRFPQLKITRLIGRGGMGAIYQARQTSLDRDVALKLIAKEVSQDPTFVERFEREAKTLAKLSHPNIVTIYDFGYTSDGVAYLIMEFVDGINLREAMKSRSVGPEDALDVVATTCRALEYAHSRGVIHRDIKPENILLGEDGSLKVVDFGIAKIVDDSVRTPTLTATRQVLGSLHYLAPEQIESPDQVDHRVDLYALGVVFYELLTGELPLGRYEPPSALYPRADKRVDSVVLKSLSRKPINRFQTAREFGTEIQQLQTGPAFAIPQSTEFPPPLPNPQAVAASAAAVAIHCDVPFTYDTWGGLAEALGMVYANERGLCIEFRTRDKLMGVLKSKSQLIQIPFEKLTRFELVTGMFSSKLLVAANSLNALSELPNAETGTVEFKIKNRDVGSAKRLLIATGFASPGRPSISKIAPAFGSKEYICQAIFGALMVLCGIMNFGSLAIAQIINANAAHSNSASLACFAISIAVLFGPIALMQLIGGILNFVLPMRSLNGVLTVVSMIPISPAWLISFPAAIWASPWMRGDADGNSVIKKQAWGATTLMFIRESRWSRVVAIANAVGLAVVAIIAGVYLSGNYPNSITYRVSAMPSAVNYDEVIAKIRGRLVDVAPHAVLEFDAVSSRLMISDWRRNTDKIRSLLAIESHVQLAWLVAAADKSGERIWLPLAGKVAQAGLATGSQGLSTTLATARPLVDVKSDLVAAVASKSESLSIELTSAGRELLAETRPDSNELAIGLVIGGMIEGVATGDAVTNKQIHFELCHQFEFSVESIEAAIRGPALPCELELIR